VDCDSYNVRISQKTRRPEQTGTFLKRPYRAALILALALALLGSLFARHSLRKPQPPIASSKAANSSQPWLGGLPASLNTSKVAARPLFPYSVIPGGVESAQELRNAIEHDPVVAGHYAGFDLAKVRVIRLDRDRMEYVSYRMGDRVYWTNHALRLFKGEKLISDGTLEARARCGNRLSATAMGPVSPKQPSAEAMEAQQAPELLATNDFSPVPFFGPMLPPPPTVSGGPPTGTVIPPLFFPPVGGGGPPKPNVPTGPPGGGTPPGPPVGPPGGPPIPTPEPASVALLAAGLSILCLFSLRKRRKA
jgi:hypothetical protein